MQGAGSYSRSSSIWSFLQMILYNTLSDIGRIACIGKPERPWARIPIYHCPMQGWIWRLIPTLTICSMGAIIELLTTIASGWTKELGGYCCIGGSMYMNSFIGLAASKRTVNVAFFFLSLHAWRRTFTKTVEKTTRMSLHGITLMVLREEWHRGW